jgi:hypothetical protein
MLYRNLGFDVANAKPCAAFNGRKAPRFFRHDDARMSNLPLDLNGAKPLAKPLAIGALRALATKLNRTK